MGKGQSHEWNFKIFRTNASNDKPAIFIGIALSGQVFAKCDSISIFAQSSIREGYAYYAHNGTKYMHKTGSDDHKYGDIGRSGDVVTMTLDMTQQSHEGAVLSFKI